MIIYFDLEGYNIGLQGPRNPRHLPRVGEHIQDGTRRRYRVTGVTWNYAAGTIFVYLALE
jgi:hypothetical protein